MRTRIDEERARRLGLPMKSDLRRDAQATRPARSNVLFVDLKDDELKSAVERTATAHGMSVAVYTRTALWLLCEGGWDRKLPIDDPLS